MKVQIEISDMALSLAILAMKGAANSDSDRQMLEQAVERCKNEVTEIDIEKADEDRALSVAFALAAIARQCELIEGGGEK